MRDIQPGTPGRVWPDHGRRVRTEDLERDIKEHALNRIGRNAFSMVCYDREEEIFPLQRVPLRPYEARVFKELGVCFRGNDVQRCLP